MTSHDPELLLLRRRTAVNLTTDLNDRSRVFKTAPIITGDAFLASLEEIFPQRAVYGQIISQQCPGFPTDVQSEKLYINTNAPFSGVVCGVQGSGKSHSTSVLLESCLIPDPRLGTLPEPLSAIVFHYDTTAGSGAVQPCEAAYVGTLDPERGGHAVPPRVTVLVLPSTLSAMRRAYSRLGTHIQVQPLRLAPEDISGERLLSMMKVDCDTQMPLYMESIMGILRSMEDSFDYQRFRDELKTRSKTFNAGQRSMLNLRLTLLDSCLEGGDRSNRATSFFRRGHLVIVDLSSAFMDSSTACGLFEIILGLFIEARNDATGKLVVLDEAHKYLTNNASSSRLTDALLSVIRQQRHLGTRVLISTQEPTVVPPQFLDLCSFVIAHRFSSPTWLKHLEQHVSTVDSNWLQKVVTLQTGEALIFAPSGVGLSIPDSIPGDSDDEMCDDFLVTRRLHRSSKATLATLGQGYLHVQSRLRVTLDGGMSIMSTDNTLRQPVEQDEPICPPTPVSSTSDNGATTQPGGRGGTAVASISAFTVDSAYLPPHSRLLPQPQAAASFPPPPSSAYTAAPLVAVAPVPATLVLSPSPATLAPASPLPASSQALPNPSSQGPEPTPSPPLSSLLPVTSATTSVPAPVNVAIPLPSVTDQTPIGELRRALLRLREEGNMEPAYTDLGVHREQFPWTYTGKIGKVAKMASEAGIIEVIRGDRVRLKDPHASELLLPATAMTNPDDNILACSGCSPLTAIMLPPPLTVSFSTNLQVLLKPPNQVSAPALPSASDLTPIEELRQALLRLCEDGNTEPTYSDLGVHREQFPWTYTGKIGKVAKLASEAGVVDILPGERVRLKESQASGLLPPTSTILDADDERDIATLKRGLMKLYRNGNRMPTFADVDALLSQNSWTYKGDIAVFVEKAARKNIVTVINGSTVSLRIPTEYRLLIDALCAEYSKTSAHSVTFVALGALLKGRFSGKLKQFIEGAAEKGFVWVRGDALTLSAELAI